MKKQGGVRESGAPPAQPPVSRARNRSSDRTSTSPSSPKTTQASQLPLQQLAKWLNENVSQRRRGNERQGKSSTLSSISATGHRAGPSVSATMTDLHSFPMKPDNSAIIRETVKQLRQIRRINQKKPTEEQASDAVQQSQVSSSKPSILANDVIGPILLEALDGFLFMVNSQGKVEFVSENVTQYIKYSSDDLVGKSIYNIIHVGDHGQFSSTLLPMSTIGQCLQWSSDGLGSKSCTFNCRMLIKPPGEDDAELEVKQIQTAQYENMQICAILHNAEKDVDTPPADNVDNPLCLVCIARRVSFLDKDAGMFGREHFSTKHDLSGKIIHSDLSGLSHTDYNFGEVLVGRHISEFCHTNDVQQLVRHLNDTLQHNTRTSGVYRFKLEEGRYVFVQTKSRLSHNLATGQPEHVHSTHTIIRECDAETELKGSASTSLMKSIIGQNTKKEKSTDCDSA